jgi:hypothetical protein
VQGTSASAAPKLESSTMLEQSSIGINITQILEQQLDPSYCFSIKTPGDGKVFFTTCDGRESNSSLL